MLDRLAPPARGGGIFLKVGFAGVSRPAQVAVILRRVVTRARELGPSIAVIAAAYADCDRARSLSPEQMLEPAIAAGASGALIDTWVKDGRGLLHYMPVNVLTDWVRRARRAGLLTALAGSLAVDDLERLREVAPDVVGVRGAACRGGRSGTLDPARLQRLRATLDPVAALPPPPSSARELPEPGAPIAPGPR